MPYKYKLTEMSKTASPEEAEKELGIPKRKFENLEQVYDIWVKKTGNVAKNITMGKERDLSR